MGTNAQGKRKHPSDEEDQDDEEFIVVPFKQEMHHEVTASSGVNSVRDVSEPELPCPWNGAENDATLAWLMEPLPRLVHLHRPLYKCDESCVKVPEMLASSCSLHIARDIQLYGGSKPNLHCNMYTSEAEAVLRWLYMRRVVYYRGPAELVDQWEYAQGWIVPAMANAAMRAMISVFDSEILSTTDDVDDVVELVGKIAEACDENSLFQLLLMYATWFSHRRSQYQLYASLLLPLTQEGSKCRKLYQDTTKRLDEFYREPRDFKDDSSCIADHEKEFMVTAEDLCLSASTTRDRETEAYRLRKQLKRITRESIGRWEYVRRMVTRRFTRA